MRQVARAGLANFIGARLPVPHNLNLAVWKDIATTPEHHNVVNVLTHGFPAGFEGKVTIPSSPNHASACDHPEVVATYIATEIEHGAMLGPFDYTPFFP